MAYDAKVIEVLIASPADVVSERRIVREGIADWNVVHSRERALMLSPIGWETHSSPELSGRPQQLINERLLSTADIVIGIFWTRLGTPTGKAPSGTVEEIQEHHRRGKPVLLYFSDASTPPSGIDPEQFKQVQEFRKWAMSEGLIETFQSETDFREKFRNQLVFALRENAYLKSLGAPTVQGTAVIQPVEAPSRSISNEAMQLLRAASNDSDGILAIRRHLGGEGIYVGGQQFGDGNRRVFARWEAAIEELHYSGMIKDLNGQGTLFRITDAGYRAAEANH
jgi:hypothetical protein